MESRAAQLAQRLAERAEAVCRSYLSNGRRNGRYWSVGDVTNAPGRSLFVRLVGPSSGRGAAGRWVDAATGEHGDLLDLITAAEGLSSTKEAMHEAERFLGMAVADRQHDRTHAPAPLGSIEAARRLWVAGEPIDGTLAERYLVLRGITGVRTGMLRFHPRCFHRASSGGPNQASRCTDDATLISEQHHSGWPALLAKVTEPDGVLTGIHRTWLDPTTADKAPLDPPRKSMGYLAGNGVRFGRPTDILAAGEGLETVLSVRMALPNLPCVAALSASLLTALRIPDGLKRLYIIADADPAGEHAVRRLAERAEAEAVQAIPLTFPEGDANDALRELGIDGLRARLRSQLEPRDVDRLLP